MDVLTLPARAPSATPSAHRMTVTRGSLLALDLGTNTGWALRTPDDYTSSGTVLLKHTRFDGGGMRFLRFRRWLEDVDQDAGPIEAVFFEEVRRHIGTDAAHIYGGLLAVLTAWCEEHLERLGTALGRMAFAGKITADQFAAAELYCELIARCNAVMGLPSEQPRSVTGLLINEGIFGGGAPEPDPELVEKIRRQAAGAALMLRTCDQDMQGSAGRRPSVLVHLLACHDVEALRWSAVDLHNLRLGLETLCRFFHIRRDC